MDSRKNFCNSQSQFAREITRMLNKTLIYKLYEKKRSSQNVKIIKKYRLKLTGPCGLMDKASDFESEDCRFESCHGRLFFHIKFDVFNKYQSIPFLTTFLII